MKKILWLLPLILFTISCDKDKDKDEEKEPECGEIGISYKLDGTTYEFNNASITGEIFPNNPDVGKIYDIWTDEGNGFYFHSSVAEQGQTCGFVANWLQNEGANIASLTQMQNQDFTFDVITEAYQVGDIVQIKFHGSYDDNNQHHEITDGYICTTIDIVH